MGIGIRMKDPQTGAEYSFDPMRDIAYFWPRLLLAAKEGLQEPRWEDWYADYLRERGVTTEALLAGWADVLHFCSDATVLESNEPAVHLRAAGFLAQPKDVQLVVCAKLGQIALAAFWTGIRHAHRANERSDVLQEMAQAASQLRATLASSSRTGDTSMSTGD